MSSESRQSLRQSHLEQTRGRILQAFMACLSDRGVDDVAVAEVADRAAVSERTIFRHFPTRVDLLAAAGTWINDNLFSYIQPKSVDEFPGVFREVCRRFDKEPNLAYAIALSRIGRTVRQGFRAEILAHNSETLAGVTSHLSADETRQAEAVVAYLDNVLAWTVMREEFEMSGEDVADAVEWALTLVIDDLKERNRRAGGDDS